MKRIWYEITSLAYNDRPELPWPERHVKVTFGKNKVKTLYEFLNPSPKSDEGIEYTTDLEFTQIERRKSLEDIDTDKIDLSGICGRFEIIMSEKPDEFKIEFF